MKTCITKYNFVKYSSDIKIYCIITIYCIALLFFSSPDSYLYDITYRDDSSWFFTAGRAWMNGMVPYVDFADSNTTVQ